MPAKKKKTARKTVKKIEPKRSLRKFMIDEDGFVSKETILKVGLAAAAGVATAGIAMDAHAEGECYKQSWVVQGLEHKNHHNAIISTATGESGAEASCFQHNNNVQHTAY